MTNPITMIKVKYLAYTTAIQLQSTAILIVLRIFTTHHFSLLQSYRIPVHEHERVPPETSVTVVYYLIGNRDITSHVIQLVPLVVKVRDFYVYPVKLCAGKTLLKENT